MTLRAHRDPAEGIDPVDRIRLDEILRHLSDGETESGDRGNGDTATLE